jgi:hypothetical protein
MDADRNKLRSNGSTDLLLEEMVRKAIVTIIPNAMSVFKDSVHKSVGKYPLTYNDKIKYLGKIYFWERYYQRINAIFCSNISLNELRI